MPNILQMKRNQLMSRLLLLLLLFVTGGTLLAQTSKVSGTVLDNNNAPLAGVSVFLKGSSQGVITDESGNFSINAPSNGVLVFSFTGFRQQEVPINGRANISVSLGSADQSLSEVVVTALGVERNKKSLGYSMQTIDGTKLSENKDLNVANALKGKVAGVHINPSAGGAGGSSFVVIRGASSLGGNNQPLYVIDGVPIDNQTLGTPSAFGGQRDFGDGIGNINPDDIESMSVLKGPAAAALYGSRGANGVILITSKKGKSGRPARVDITSNSTFESPNVLPKFQNTWGGGYNDNYADFGKKVIDGVEYDSWPTWLVDNWGGKMDGRLIAIDAWPELGVVKYSPQPADNWKEFFRTGKTFTNTIAVSGGNDKGTYRLSVSDMRNEGIIPNNTLKRQNINLLASLNVTKKLMVETKVNYIRQSGYNRPEVGGLLTSPIASLMATPRFIDLDWQKDYKRENGTMVGWKSGSPSNPYWLLNELTSKDSRDRVIGYVLARYKFTNWLSLQARTGTDFYNETRSVRIGINTPGTLDGSISNDMYKVKESNSDLLLTAAGDLSDKFSGSFSVGGNHLNRQQEQVGFTGTGFNIAGLYHINNSRNKSTRHGITRKVINSAYFTGQLGYKNFLFLDVTGRNDWSSTLGLNHQSFFYPSVSTSFVFSDLLSNSLTFLDYGKLRVSYAEAGNDADPYRTAGGYNLSNLNFNGQPYAAVNSTVPLADLKNELTRSFEIGTEMRFFKNRLGLDLTYYSSATFNQIINIGLSSATGYASRMINAGEIQNKGVEILLSGTPVRSKNFSWDMMLNLSRNKSKVVALAPGISTYRMLSATRASIQATPGESFGNIIGYDYMRTPDGQILLTETGKFQKATEATILGNIQPDWLGGLTNSFTYKGITLSALIDFRKGGQIFSQSYDDQSAKGTGKFTENRTNLIAEGVIEGPDGKYTPSNIVLVASDYYAGRSAWGDIATDAIIDADYAALREASIGYNIGASRLLNKTFFKGTRVSVVGRNLFYLYRDAKFKTMGISPETAFNTTIAGQGYEAKGVPTTRSIGVNLSFTF
jgi:TonB-linked SusC/RagA family outer membrane protein